MLIRRVYVHFSAYLVPHPFGAAIARDFETARVAAREGREAAARLALMRIASIAATRQKNSTPEAIDVALATCAKQLAEWVQARR